MLRVHRTQGALTDALHRFVLVFFLCFISHLASTYLFHRSGRAVRLANDQSSFQLISLPSMASLASLTIEDVERIMKFLISNCLSYGVVFGASILKVPQIICVWRSKSAQGISLAANYVEVFSYVISTSWGLSQGLHFRDFGENAFIFAQLVVLIAMVSRLQRAGHQATMVLTTELAVFYLFLAGYVPRVVHERLLGCQILLNISSRVSQILLNYRGGSTGQLSFLTFFLAFGGGLARLMTTALNVPWEKAKATYLLQFGVAAALNFIILAQMAHYKYKRRGGLPQRKRM